jgi:hypothetical protein
LDEIDKLRQIILDLKRENESLQQELDYLHTQNDPEVEGLLAEVTLLEEKLALYEQPPDALTIEGSDEEAFYLGSSTRQIFHRPTCKWASYIPKYKLIEFGSHREAVEALYRPFKTCRA